MFEIVRVKFGSHLYGTTTATSDEDFKAVYIPSPQDILLGRVKKSVIHKTKHDREQQVNGLISRNVPGDIDTEILALQHYFNLLAEGDTMALDMLYANGYNCVHATPIWHRIQANRPRLITRKVEKAINYVNTQAKKYGIKGSRVHACRKIRDFLVQCMEKNPNDKLMVYKDQIPDLIYGLESACVKLVPQPDGTDHPHLEVVGKLLPYGGRVKDAHKTLDAFMNKYGNRALEAEANQGVDWKALSHAVRVGYEVVELLQSGHITFPRPERGLLISIKQGEYGFKEVSQLITDLRDEVSYLGDKSDLPATVDQAWIDDFVADYYESSVLNTLTRESISPYARFKRVLASIRR